MWRIGMIFLSPPRTDISIILSTLRHTPKASTSLPLSTHSLRALTLQPLDCQIPLMLHDPSLLEVRDPAIHAALLECLQLFRARLTSLFVLLDAVDDAVAIETLEEAVTALPT